MENLRFRLIQQIFIAGLNRIIFVCYCNKSFIPMKIVLTLIWRQIQESGIGNSP
jgi:hypothetical protein